VRAKPYDGYKRTVRVTAVTSSVRAMHYLYNINMKWGEVRGSNNP